MFELLGAYLAQLTIFGLFITLILAGLGVPIPEDLILVTAGVLAYQGVVDLYWTIIVLYVGVLASDLILYGFGRRFGEVILRHPRVLRFLTLKRQARIERYFARYGNRTVFLMRHLAVLRAPTYIMAGAMQVPGWKFLLWDGLAAFISVPAFVFLGYFFADDIELLYRELQRFEHLIGVGAILAIIGYLLLRYREVWWAPAKRVE
jgi:membrane protein DedA with SNARE-associated domain